MVDSADDHARIDIAKDGEGGTETRYSDERVVKGCVVDKEGIEGSVHILVRPLGQFPDNGTDVLSCYGAGVSLKRRSLEGTGRWAALDADRVERAYLVYPWLSTDQRRSYTTCG